MKSAAWKRPLVIASLTLVWLGTGRSNVEDASAADATILLPQPVISLVNPGHSTLQCRVTNTCAGGVDNLDALFDMASADQGTIADDPVNKVTWILFGDTADTECVGKGPTCEGNAWYGSNGGNAMGYLSGRGSYRNPQAVCGSLGILTQPGLISSSGGSVFAPDLHTAPSGDTIGNYLFQSPTPPTSLPNNTQVLPTYDPATSAISGTNEGFSSTFAYKGKLYIFFGGAPGLVINGDCTLGLPRRSVSYLATWTNPSTPGKTGYGPPDFQILSRVDYNLEAFVAWKNQNYANTKTCAVSSCATGSNPVQVYLNDGTGLAACKCVPAVGTGMSCSQSDHNFVPLAPPGDWVSSPPLAGHFNWVTAVVQGRYLYLFGTGNFRMSPVYLARLPLVHNGKEFPDFVRPYLKDTPGLEFYDSNAKKPWNRTPGNATPLTFDGDANDQLGEVSVRYFAQVGVWLMAYARTTGGNGQQMILRWATSPTGVWHELDMLDMTLADNQQEFCLTNAPGPTCQAPQPPQGFNTCFSFYNPILFPYLTNVSVHLLGGQTITNFTISYLLSSFKPYDSGLFTADLQSARKIKCTSPQECCILNGGQWSNGQCF